MKGCIVISVNWSYMSDLGVIRQTLFIMVLSGSQSSILWTSWAEVIWKHRVWMAVVLDVLYPWWDLQWQCRAGNVLGKELFSRMLSCLPLSVNSCANPVFKWKSPLIGRRQSCLLETDSWGHAVSIWRPRCCHRYDLALNKYGKQSSKPCLLTTGTRGTWIYFLM